MGLGEIKKSLAKSVKVVGHQFFTFLDIENIIQARSFFEVRQ